MKISESSLSMLSTHEHIEERATYELLHVRSATGQPVPSQAIPTLSLSPEARSAASTDIMSPESLEAKISVLLAVLERLLGYKFNFRLYNGPEAGSDTSTSATQGSNPSAGLSGQYTRVEAYYLSEKTDFQASGTILTSDGQQIRFNLNLSMQYQYSETSTTHIEFGNVGQKTDPLVINFNGTAAQLSDQYFTFDLDSDGTAETLSAPVYGSGFLALDKNANGTIDDGAELFGTASGDGFRDLAQYDLDGNGWIDENDAVFAQLQVWQPAAEGESTLHSLSSLGIGAISVQSISTPFDIRNAFNQVLGSVRASGVVLNENGTVGSVQQVDLVA